ncbi:MAG TPA: acyltransferase [Verrucomicrobiae bacterium]|nr:acyltransferase [Verrucomicrobiae bacterium]
MNDKSLTDSACVRSDEGLDVSSLNISFSERKESRQLALMGEELTAAVTVNTGEIPNLDFLRACAVLFVLASHLLLYFRLTIPGPLNFYDIGRWGVLIFFVHTTLVLLFSLERHACQVSSTRLYWSFLIRRAFRILPLSVLVVCLVELFGLPVGHLRNGHFMPVHLKLPGVLANLFLVQNLTHTESATAPLWTLPYEMQMYFLLPVLFLLVRSIGVLLPISCLWLASILAVQHAPWLERHRLPDFILYVPYFLPGVFAYKFISGSRIRLPSIFWPMALAMITALYLWSPSPIHGAMCCLILGLIIPHFAQVSDIGVAKIAQLIARYSYGIYLTHFICIWLAFEDLSGLSRLEQWALFLMLLFLVPVTLYHLIEAPMIQVGRRVASKLC